jgi:biotin operon repressor
VRLFGILSERANATGQAQEHLFWSLWRSSDLGEIATFEELYPLYTTVFKQPTGEPQSKRALRRLLAGNALHWRVVQSRRRGACFALIGAADVAYGLCVPLKLTGARYVRDGIDIDVPDAAGSLAHRNSIAVLPSLVRGTDDPRSQQLIGTQNGMSRRSLATHAKKLAELGHLVVTRNEIVVAVHDDHLEATKIREGLVSCHPGRVFFLRSHGEQYAVCTASCNEYEIGNSVSIARTRSVKRVRARLRSTERMLGQTRCEIQGEHAPSRTRRAAFLRNDKSKARRTRRRRHEPQKPHPSAVIIDEGSRRFTHVVGCVREHAAWYDGMVANG